MLFYLLRWTNTTSCNWRSFGRNYFTNSVKIKILTGTFTPSSNLFLASSDLINTTGSKIFSVISLSDNLPIFEITDNVALLTTSDSHGVGVGEKINVDIFPDDSTTTTTYYVRKRIYQETIFQTLELIEYWLIVELEELTFLMVVKIIPRTYIKELLYQVKGSGAKADILVNQSGSVTQVTITEKGSGYERFDILTVGEASLGKQIQILQIYV